MTDEIKKQQLPEEIDFWNKKSEIKKIFAPNLTDSEFNAFVGLGVALGANPFTREIWAVKYDEKEPAQIFCGRDFYRRKAQEQPDYIIHQVNAVYKNDSFELIDGQPKHQIKSFSREERGSLEGAFCVVYQKDKKYPYFVMVYVDEYEKRNKNGELISNWKTMRETMIKKVAEAQALRGAYQGIFKGTYDESEVFYKHSSFADSVDVTKQVIDELRQELSHEIGQCKNKELKQQIIDEVTTAEAQNSLTSEKLEQWITTLKESAPAQKN